MNTRQPTKRDRYITRWYRPRNRIRVRFACRVCGGAYQPDPNGFGGGFGCFNCDQTGTKAHARGSQSGWALWQYLVRMPRLRP